MDIESWMVALLIFGIGFIGGYAVLRAKVGRLEADYKDHIEQSETRIKALYDKIDVNDKDCHIRVDASFKRIDGASEKITILERDTANLLDLPTAEAKFVTRKELDLHLEKIEIITTNTNKEVGLLMGKQDNILELLHKMSEGKE